MYYEELIPKDKDSLVYIHEKEMRLECYKHFKEEYQKSIQKLSIAIDLNANYQYNFNLRACAYYNLKNYDKAIEDATKAIDLNSDEPEYFNFSVGIFAL